MKMRTLVWIGLVVLVLGLASLVVPIPQSEKEGLTVGNVSIGVETTSNKKLPPILSAVMILGGLGAIAAGKGKGS